MVINHVTTLYKNGRQTTLAALAVTHSVVWLSLSMMQHESDPGTLKHYFTMAKFDPAERDFTWSSRQGNPLGQISPPTM